MKKRTKGGQIGAYIDADTVNRFGRVARSLAIALLVTVSLAIGVRYANGHLALWRPSNAWPMFLSRFFPIAVGLMLTVTTMLWLLLRAAHNGSNPRRRTL